MKIDITLNCELADEILKAKLREDRELLKQEIARLKKIKPLRSPHLDDFEDNLEYLEAIETLAPYYGL